MIKEQFLWVEKYRPKKVQDTILPEGIKAMFQQFVDIPRKIKVIGTGDMDGWTVAQVRNVNGVSQLPSTGGVGTALTVAAALSAAAVLLALSIELRRLSAR